MHLISAIFIDFSLTEIELKDNILLSSKTAVSYKIIDTIAVRVYIVVVYKT
jgi:hypothetical protein